mmetsp:Transcript_14965/g.42523  ORF Transcript_14965/g.42523 Transcript_14965/m.42523 type:complete len:276 (-) Transcript_14965:197-1024(-)
MAWSEVRRIVAPRLLGRAILPRLRCQAAPVRTALGDVHARPVGQAAVDVGEAEVGGRKGDGGTHGHVHEVGGRAERLCEVDHAQKRVLVAVRGRAVAEGSTLVHGELPGRHPRVAAALALDRRDAVRRHADVGGGSLLAAAAPERGLRLAHRSLWGAVHHAEPALGEGEARAQRFLAAPQSVYALDHDGVAHAFCHHAGGDAALGHQNLRADPLEFRRHQRVVHLWNEARHRATRRSVDIHATPHFKPLLERVPCRRASENMRPRRGRCGRACRS